MAWISVTTADAYFANKANGAEWQAKDNAEKLGALESATSRLEVIPFIGDNPNRTAARYTNASVGNGAGQIPYLLYVAVSELALWSFSHNLDEQALTSAPVSGAGSVRYASMSRWLDGLPLVVQNALSSFIDNSAKGQAFGSQALSVSFSDGGAGSSSAINPVVSIQKINNVLEVRKEDGTVERFVFDEVVQNTDPYHFFLQRKDIAINIPADTRILDSGVGYDIPFFPKHTHTQSAIANRNFETDPEGFINLHIAGSGVTRVDISLKTTHHFSDIDSSIPDLTTDSRTEEQEVVLGEANSVNLRAHGSNVVLTSQSTGGALAGQSIPVSIVVNIKTYNTAGNRVAATFSAVGNKCGITFKQLANNSGASGAVSGIPGDTVVNASVANNTLTLTKQNGDTLTFTGGTGGGSVDASRLLPTNPFAGGIPIQSPFDGWVNGYMGHEWNGNGSTNTLGYYPGAIIFNNGAAYAVKSAISPGSTLAAAITAGHLQRIDRNEQTGGGGAVTDLVNIAYDSSTQMATITRRNGTTFNLDLTGLKDTPYKGEYADDTAYSVGEYVTYTQSSGNPTVTTVRVFAVISAVTNTNRANPPSNSSFVELSNQEITTTALTTINGYAVPALPN